MGFTGTTRFELVRKLGEGGMGVVYEAFDHERSMSVALKTLRNLDATSLYRFKREFRALLDVSHPNIVGLYELVYHGDDWFFTMELLEGGDFIRYVRPGDDGGARLPTATLSPTSQETQETREIQVVDTPPTGNDVTDPMPSAAPYSTHVDDHRLRRGLVQLAQALDAIHRAGMVHRDLKPSNVRVTPAGRIVLMDFGIVAEASAPVDDSDEPRAIGTPSFMAPEQAAGAPATAAADWYALGVMLYIALTGRLPFSGPRDAVLVAKQSQDPVSPDQIAEDVPHDLARLCIDLLQRDPSARPPGEEVLLRLGADAGAAPETTTMGGSAFVGRGRELSDLRRAYDEAREGTAVACLVIGASGMGKSTLVRRFAHELGGATRVRDTPVVVRGRCHERESLPYKAFDSIVDHLTHFLVGLSPERAAELLPEDVDLLTRLFPVLRRVPGVQTARPLGGFDRQELRRRAFAVLRELLTRIAAWRPLVVGIDDLQWADEDSIDLLEALLAPPSPPPLLLIAAIRAENVDSSAPAIQRALRAVEVAGNAHRLELGPLTSEEQDQLVGRLMGTGASAFDPSLWRQSAGSPFFLGELVRYARERGTLGSEDAPALDQVLRERIARLPDAARNLLQAVAVSGEPTPLGTLAEAVDLDAAARERALAVLRVGHLVRVARHGQDPAVAPYHDRIRETLVDNLDAEHLRDLHYRLALALERAGGSIDALARHWLGTGDREQATSYLVSAAEAAQSVLAFGRAAELYRAAIDLGGHDDDQGRTLREGMADALTLAGHYYEAAVAYREAASGADEDAVLELTRKSADNFLRSGHVALGLEALGAIMGRLGITYARTHRRALMSLGWQRVRSFFRGLRYKPRAEAEIAARDLGRLDTLYAASTALGMIDHIRGADLQTRHLLQALRFGEEHRVIRALSIEAVFRAAAGGRGLRSAEILGREVELRARRIGDPCLVAVALIAVAASAFLGARPRAAVEAFTEVDELLTTQCVGADWERITARFMMCLAQIQLGELAAVARAGARLTAEANSRNDAYERNLFATQPTTWRHLLADRPDDALAALEGALEGWPNHTFYMAHYFVVAARSIVHLYQGDPARAGEVLDQIWPKMRTSQLHRFRWLMVEYLHYRSLAAWGTGDRGPVHKMIRHCESFGRVAGIGMARGHRGFLALHDGDESRGLELLLEAQRMMEEAGFRAIARGFRYRIATLTAGAEGERIRQECLDGFAAEGAAVPERMVDLFAPPLPKRLRLALPQAPV